MPAREYPTIEFLRLCLREENGRLFWIRRPRDHFPTVRAWNRWNTCFAGMEAGTDMGGRWKIRIGRSRLLRRYTIVWALHRGEWCDFIDHKNRVTTDDRIGNLRPATKSLNNVNSKIRVDNKSGYKGVSRFGEKWRASIGVMGKSVHLGLFVTVDEAYAAYIRAARAHFGEYHCEG